MDILYDDIKHIIGFLVKSSNFLESGVKISQKGTIVE